MDLGFVIWLLLGICCVVCSVASPLCCGFGALAVSWVWVISLPVGGICHGCLCLRICWFVGLWVAQFNVFWVCVWVVRLAYSLVL